MLNREGYEALTHIYDASVNLGRWRRALDAVCKSLDAKAIALLIRGHDPSARDLQMLNSTYLKMMRSPWGLYYITRLSKLQNPDWQFLSQQTAHVPVQDTEIGLSAQELDRRKDYAFLRKRLGVGRRLGVRLNADKVWFDAMSIAFEAGSAGISPKAMAQCQPLLPHLTKSVEIGRTFRQLKSRYSAVLTALNHVRVGLAIALSSGEVIVQNDEAERILDLKDGIVKRPDGRLFCHDPDQTAELASAVSSMASTARGEGDKSEVFMPISRPSGAAALLVDVAPLRDSHAEIETQLEGALITIIDPDRVPVIRMERFIALYDLTSAEAEVCKLVIKGLTVGQITEQRNTSPATAKNQVSAILDKTGVRRRAELIRLVIRVLPPVT